MPSVKANNSFKLNDRARNIIDSYQESSDEEDAGMVTQRQAKQDLTFTKSKTQKDVNQEIIDKFLKANPDVNVASKKPKGETEESVKSIEKKIKKLKKKLQAVEKDEENADNMDTAFGQEDEHKSKKKRILKEISFLKESLVVKSSQLKRKKNQDFREGKEEEEVGKQLVVKTIANVEQKPEIEVEKNISLTGSSLMDDDEEEQYEPPSKKSNQLSSSSDLSKSEKTNPQQTKKRVIVEYVPPYTRKSYSVSIAIPGCILDSNMSEEQKTLLCISIARACTGLKVNEIIIYNEKGESMESSNFLPNIEPPMVTEMKTGKKNKKNDFISLAIDRNVYLANMLYYLETPPYLREKLIPNLKMLKFAMSLPQDVLDSAHHLNAMEMSHPFREGLVLEEGDLVYVGHSKLVKLKSKVPPGLRVTVEIYNTLQGHHEGRIVSSETPKQKKGLYWGYNVRLVSSFSEIFTDCPYKEGYDTIITHAEFGKSIDSKDYDLPSFKHLLLVLGGMHNISGAIQGDVNIVKNYNSRNLFDQIINLCPNNGLRSMRIDDVLSLGMGALRKRIDFNMPPAEVKTKDLSSFLLPTKQ